MFKNAVSLSIGDTSEPIPSPIIDAIKQAADHLSTHEGYKGYGPEQGERTLREKIARVVYNNTIDPDEIFISDGAKCDIGRLQLLFGKQVTIAVQNPTYPVYLDTGLFFGQKVIFMDCLPENQFFPNSFPLGADLIFLCSPNNPTGSVFTHEQLQQLVDGAHREGSFIIFDAAYSGFIRDPSLPRSIYEVKGADAVAIEISSFSKLIGFTGLRLGWSVIPKHLTYQNGGSVHEDFHRIVTTFFNGASNLAQAGGIAALSHQDEIKKIGDFYRENARLIREALQQKGGSIYGGENAPYLWVDFREKIHAGGSYNLNSWDLFQTLLQSTQIITTPGSGFGSCGEGFLRFSAFGKRQNILQAISRIQTQWPEQLSLSLI